MADDSQKIIDELQARTQEFRDTESKLLAANNIKASIEVGKLALANERLISARRELLTLEKDLLLTSKDSKKITDEQKKAFEELYTKQSEANKAVLNQQKQIAGGNQEITRSQLESNEASIEYWKTQTLQGKAFGLLTSSVAKFTGALTFGALAMKALTRHAEAADLRQKLLIQSFRGLDTSGTREAAKQTQTLATALTSANATAIRFGVSTSVVSEAMVKFSRLTGTNNPEALGKLTEATMAVASAMGVDTAEAADYVGTRMEKFGGTATSALLSLDEMRKGIDATNNEFGRTVLRGDDVIRTITEISRNTEIYAIDQRFMGQVLRDNIARMQSMGESYDFAAKQAKAYSEATTTGQPQWMKLVQGDTLLKSIGATLGKNDEGKEFMKKFGDDLEAAKPGLSEKVKAVFADMNAGKINRFDAMQLVQQYTEGTKVGAKLAAQSLVDLATKGGGLNAIMSQYHLKDAISAQAMLTNARKQIEIEDKKLKLRKMNSAELVKTLNISKKQADAMEGQKDLLDAYVDNTMGLGEADKKRQEGEKTAAEAKSKAIDVEIEKKEQIIKEFGAGSEIGKAAATSISGMKVEKAQYEAKTGKPEEVSKLDPMTKEIKDGFLNASINTGRYVKEIVEKMSNGPVLLAAALTAGLAKYLGLTDAKLWTRYLAGIEKNTQGGGGGGGGNAISNAADALDTAKDLKKPGFFKRMTGKLGAKKGVVGKLARGIGKTAGFLGRGARAASGLFSKLGGSKVMGALGKFGSVGKSIVGGNAIGKILTMGLVAKDAIEGYKKGGIRGAAVSAIPAITSTVGMVAGGALGTMAGGPVGTIAGGMAGNMAGDWIGEKLKGMIGTGETPAAAAATGADAATAAAQAANPAVAAAQSMAKATATVAGGMPSMSTMGGVQSDGSVMIKLTNFMDAFTSAKSLARQNS